LKELSDDELRMWRKDKPPQGYIDCPNCLHGWRRDVEPHGLDEECSTCACTGFLIKGDEDKWT
jgi:hypothetical protein